jgi:hypothetical protein
VAARPLKEERYPSNCGAMPGGQGLQRLAGLLSLPMGKRCLRTAGQPAIDRGTDALRDEVMPLTPSEFETLLAQGQGPRADMAATAL